MRRYRKYRKYQRIATFDLWADEWVYSHDNGPWYCDVAELYSSGEFSSIQVSR